MMMEQLLPMLGVALCAMALLQLVFWATQSFSHWQHNKQQFEISRDALRKQIEAAANVPAASQDQQDVDDGSWKGFREFEVAQLNRETALAMSVILKPIDGRPFVQFKPGQHLTFKFDIPSEPKPVVRCYSLSNGPGKPYYRITVKKNLPPRDKPDVPAGLVSSFVNQSLMVGERVQVKAPSGHFYLDEDSKAPIVMMAGGIGITPMLSMIERIIDSGTKRLAILFYGSRNGEDHAFKDYLKTLAEDCENLHVINVYSDPLESEIESVDYHKRGFIDVDLLKSVLPSNHCQFYMCGPPPFMQAMYEGMTEWQVPDSRIFYEAFGPASIKKKSKDSAIEPKVVGVPVTFSKTGKSVHWNGNEESLLEFAEDNDVIMDSGCRAGSCGTCETAILNGKVSYPDEDAVDCAPGHCLTCIARPDGPLELDA